MATKKKATKKAVKNVVTMQLSKQEQELVNKFRRLQEALKREATEVVEDSYDIVEEIDNFIGDVRYASNPDF